MKTQVFTVTLLIAVAICSATLTPSKRGKRVAKELKAKQGPQSHSVIDRNLVEEEPVGRDILLEHAAYCRDTDRKLFDGTVLGYVTPVGLGNLHMGFIDKILFCAIHLIFSGTITATTWQKRGVPNSMSSRPSGCRSFAVRMANMRCKERTTLTTVGCVTFGPLVDIKTNVNVKLLIIAFPLCLIRSALI